jgi:uncharacterized protein YecE (DUF72 family)
MAKTSNGSAGEPQSGRVLVGTSGFSYAEWRGIFYPQDLPSKKFLSYYSQRFSTTEINNTFYRLPTLKLTEGWYSEVSGDFSFTLKLSQKITHIKRLKNCDEEMEVFLNAAAGLKERLGPILVQLPPNSKKNTETLSDFLSKYANRGRLAFEFRNDSWFDQEVYDLLREHNSALGVVEKEDGADAVREVTGPFVYMRLRKGDYSGDELKEWAKWIRRQQVDVYCYLKHDEKAPVLATQMLEALEGA